MTIGEIADVIKDKDNIAITSHIMPDGDSIGSTLALYSVLKRIGKNVDVYSSDKVPGMYSFLPYCEKVKSCCDKGMNKRYDIVVVLDCGSMERTGECIKLKDAADICINIDHHVTNSMYGDYNFVDTDVSSTGELIFRLIKSMGIDASKGESECMYTAILTDTGGFRYSNTSLATHMVAGELISNGIDFGEIYDKIYSTYEYNTVKILGKVLAGIEIFSGDRIAFMQLLREDMGHLKFDDIDTTDFIDYARDISTVEAAVFFKEVSRNEIKISMRSKKRIDVRAICEKYGGGGHIKAAGCTMKGSIYDVRNIILHDIECALKDGNK